jgi:predicted secreted acid phosphatase
MSYYDSGRYQKELTTLLNQAQDYLKQRLNDNIKLKNPQKFAIVMDIDETALSSYKAMRLMEFADNYAALWTAMAESNNTALAPTLNLYRYAKNHGVAVFFISLRPEAYRHVTERNLRDAGYFNWDGLYMKPERYRNDDLVEYNLIIRKRIVENGYSIILNIGDSPEDLRGGFAEKAFQLPNPFY